MDKERVCRVCGAQAFLNNQCLTCGTEQKPPQTFLGTETIETEEDKQLAERVVAKAQEILQLAKAKLRLGISIDDILREEIKLARQKPRLAVSNMGTLARKVFENTGKMTKYDLNVAREFTKAYIEAMEELYLTQKAALLILRSKRKKEN